MTVPTVSVVLPVRDGAEHLVEALESIRAQTFDDYELIVVDDGSRDESAAIALEHGATVIRQEREGLVAALQRGTDTARGRYVARMDADDVSLPRRLEAQVRALDEDGLDACGGQIEEFPSQRRGYSDWVNSLVTPELAARDVFVECPLPHPTLVVRRDALEAAGGYRDQPWPEDYDLVLRLWARGARFRNVEELVLRWRDRPDRLSRLDTRYSIDSFVRCKVHHLRATLLGDRDVIVWGAGPVGKSFARALGAQVTAFVEVDPRKIGKRIYGVPVLAIDDAPRTFSIGAVAGEEPRAQIREQVSALGLREGVDFVAVA